MALKEKVYWESRGWKSTSQLPLQCSMAKHSSEKQKSKKASIQKATKKAEPHMCFLTIEKENLAAAYYNSAAASSGPCSCTCKSSAQFRDNCFGTSAGRPSVDSIVIASRTSVDSRASSRQTTANSLVGARRSVDSAIVPQCPEELSARLHVGRRAKASKEKLGFDQNRKNLQTAIKGSNVHAHERLSGSKDDGCKNVNVELIKCPNVYANQRISRSKDAKSKDVQWKDGTNVCAHESICRSMDDKCKNGQCMEGSNVYAHERISRSIDSGLYVKIRSSDMPISMQLHVVQLTKQVLDKQQEHLSLMDTARALKKGLDTQHGYVWHCVVGVSYGSYVTHSVGSAIYFSVGNLAILLFKTNLALRSSSP